MRGPWEEPAVPRGRRDQNTNDTGDMLSVTNAVQVKGQRGFPGERDTAVGTGPAREGSGQAASPRREARPGASVVNALAAGLRRVEFRCRTCRPCLGRRGLP